MMGRSRDNVDKAMKLHDISFSPELEQLEFNDWIHSDQQVAEYKNNYGDFEHSDISSNWRIYSENDGNSEIQLWIEKFSLSIGEELVLHLAAEKKNTGKIEIYRLGWYDGLGGLKLSTEELELLKGNLWNIGDTMPQWREWPVSKTILINESFQPGLHLIKITNSDGNSVFNPFIVKGESTPFRTTVLVPWVGHQCLNWWGGVSAHGTIHGDEWKGYVDHKRDIFNKYSMPSEVNLDIHRPFFNGRGGDLIKYLHRVIASLERENIDYTLVTDYDISEGESIRKGSDIIIAGRLRYMIETVTNELNIANANGMTIIYLDAIHHCKSVEISDKRTVTICKGNKSKFDLPIVPTGPIKLTGLNWGGIKPPLGKWLTTDSWDVSKLPTNWEINIVLKTDIGTPVGLLLKSPNRSKLFMLGWSGWNSWFDGNGKICLPIPMHNWLIDSLEQPLLKENIQDMPLVSIVMTAYNAQLTVKKSILSLLQQTYRNIELIIVDDCSNDNTSNILYDIARLDYRVRVIRNPINRGTYWSKNFGLSQAKGFYLSTHDADDISAPTRVMMQMKKLIENDNAYVCIVDYERRELDGTLVLNRGVRQRLSYQCMMWKRHPITSTLGFFDSVRTSADDEYYHRIRLFYGKNIVKALIPLYHAIVIEGSLTMDPDNLAKLDDVNRSKNSHLSDVRSSYVNSYSDWHSGVKQGENPFVRFPLVERKFTAPKKISIKDWPQADKITISMATFPPRQEIVELVIRNLLPQVDRINIYLNDYDTIPQFLQHPKINAVLSKDADGDLRDNGKFYFLDEIEEGYHIMVDDDINYPENYIATLILKIEQYGRNAIVGSHGVILDNPVTRFFQNRTVYNFTKSLDRDCFVNLLGTGTVCYHTSTISMQDFSAKHTGMADVYLALLARQQNVPMVCIQRPSGWMSEIDHGGGTLWEEFKIDDKKQTKLVKVVDNWHRVEYSDSFIQFCRQLLESHNSIQLASMGFDVLAITRIGLLELTGIQSLGN